MKEMFITGMNNTKTYVEPTMKVIEVDVESLVAGSQNNPVVGPDSGSNNNEEDDLPEEVKRTSSFDDLW